MNIKRTIVRIAPLLVTFIISVTISALPAAHLTGPQREQSVIQKCRSNCTYVFQTCFKTTKGNPPEREKCYTRRRQCFANCEPVVSPND